MTDDVQNKMDWNVPGYPVRADTLGEWQEILDILAELADIPAALIMRLTGENIEVLASSDSDGNPYHPGDAERFFDSGLYCETVIRSNDKLVVPDALSDPDWDSNPDVKLGMTSYLGFPIRLPDRRPFGTICILDSGPRKFSAATERLVERFRDLVEHHLGLIEVSRALGLKNADHEKQIEQIQMLKGLIPICAWCRNLRSEDGFWKTVEEYLDGHPDVSFTHGICPDCRDSRLASEAVSGSG